MTQRQAGSIRITSVAHPPAAICHGHPADLNDAEIATTDLAGLPVFREHMTNTAPIGRVLTSYQPTRGEDAGALMCESLITDPDAIKRIETGEERGVSLGTELIHDMVDGRVLSRINKELSVCAQGARPGCVTKWIARDNEPGRRVASTHRASTFGARKTPPKNRSILNEQIRTLPAPSTLGRATCTVPSVLSVPLVPPTRPLDPDSLSICLNVGSIRCGA